ncbi:ABC transporter permease [Oharaeibacter diazotrophicus]|uniref:Spermidine/putrescine transport system permease protein n=1 Tax=Oharaeibacter diazotrophicus TaxID=1920512 RepID=A0A4R6RIJ0_9HYPH|nr:ABC transporter permease [Oharaeibacter diazotrophicus]TDP86329.1 spermidine/putrescine transport system permease protein [Oharaeibacter diazotrophicus]BBE71728.1 inner membrane ABC transporter permease protein YdcV [Pleomorphomonas sp. SM30]GLS78494.1 spermidine/putrescine ABC transporter permease [Oharaeibacter diazotrophicus]
MISRHARNALVDAALVGSVALLLVFFYVPIVTLVAFSFTSSRVLTLPIEGFSLEWYGELVRKPDFWPAVTNSALVAAISTVFATVLGTAGAIAWIRFRFRFQNAFRAVTFAPLLFPQLLLGVVMLLWFSVLGNWLGFSTGLATVIVGHVVYVTPFALVIVAVQVYGFDASLEDAARDAGATGWEVFREVTFPLLWPGVFSAASFSFLLSWGNFYVSYSLAGSARTLPVFVYSGIAVGSSPIYPALATLNFVPALALVAVAEVMRRRALKRQRLPTAEG